MPTIILDRDGVINHDSDDYIKNPDEWTAIEGSLQAIQRLHVAGYNICVATNQSGLGRGLFDLETLTAIHQKMGISFEQYCEMLGNPTFISPAELAAIVLFCWQQPPHICIRDIAVMPTDCSF